jgi:hypothetical protein
MPRLLEASLDGCWLTDEGVDKEAEPEHAVFSSQQSFVFLRRNLAVSVWVSIYRGVGKSTRYSAPLSRVLITSMSMSKSFP